MLCLVLTVEVSVFGLESGHELSVATGRTVIIVVLGTVLLLQLLQGKGFQLGISVGFDIAPVHNRWWQRSLSHGRNLLRRRHRLHWHRRHIIVVPVRQGAHRRRRRSPACGDK